MAFFCLDTALGRQYHCGWLVLYMQEWEDYRSTSILHCETTSALWCAIFICIGLTWVMLRRVVDLYAFGESWEVVLNVYMCGSWFWHAFCGIFGGKEIIDVLKNRKRTTTMVDLKSFFFKTFYHSITALNFYMHSFYNFLNFFSLSSEVFLLYTLCVLGLRLLRF